MAYPAAPFPSCQAGPDLDPVASSAAAVAVVAVFAKTKINENIKRKPFLYTLNNDVTDQSKKEGKDQESIQSSTTPDP